MAIIFEPRYKPSPPLSVDVPGLGLVRISRPLRERFHPDRSDETCQLCGDGIPDDWPRWYWSLNQYDESIGNPDAFLVQHLGCFIESHVLNVNHGIPRERGIEKDRCTAISLCHKYFSEFGEVEFKRAVARGRAVGSL